jgi:hypothetical protein
LRKDLPYDAGQSFAPVARIATASNVLVVNVDVRQVGSRLVAARQGETRRG